ncbi:methionyl-tRNA formyltransferase [Halobacteroides halobius DSM 5150]|uniref:Methionyl-tRNA formyltransferase n=1 Tax=Halobacteroides halobius (strain ATCC 35273 / DSM 5150 / MD-1) TaxID=748449 RepID=L0K9T2_HALHC|nr:methionyl-tRNA formyltransferase [Halobacteroides halobius]AGB40848.1 methionyl-tRNA formyltransferase [Halobacteroides halobius DSM 5150]
MEVVFMGTPDFAVPCLDALCQSEVANLIGVVSQPDRKRGRGQKRQPTPVKKKALEYDIEVFQPQKVTSEEGIDKLKEWDPDLIVVVAYGQILGTEVLNLPQKGCVNVHASLLPQYRGAAPIHRAIINGDQKTGITTMYMDEGMDTGDMILTKEVTITDQDTVGSLHDKLATTGANLLITTLKEIEAGTAPRKKQNDGQATYAPKIKKEEGEINWNQEAKEIWNLIRGMNPWPGAYTYINGERLKLWASQVYSKDQSKEMIPGTIIKTDTEEGIIVQTGQGQLLLTKVQPASKQRMSATDYLLGYDLQEGTKLGK